MGMIQHVSKVDFGRMKKLVPIVILVLFCLCFFWKAIVGDCNIINFGILKKYYYPYVDESTRITIKKTDEAFDNIKLNFPYTLYAYERIRNNEIPFWNPYQFCGNTYIASGQPTIFYPLYWLAFKTMSFFNAYNFLIIFHFIVFSIAAYLLARRFSLYPITGVFVSLVSTYNIWMVTWSMRPVWIVTCSFIPVIAYFLVTFFKTRRTWVACLAGLALGLHILAGYSQLVLYTMAMSFIIFLYYVIYSRSYRNRRMLLHYLTGYGIFLILGLSIGGVQLIPLAEYVSEQVRPRLHYDFSLIGIFKDAVCRSVTNAVSFLVPSFVFRDPIYSDNIISKSIYLFTAMRIPNHGYYIGLFPLILAIVSLKFINRKRDYSLYYLIAGLTLLPNTIRYFYYLLYKVNPGFSNDSYRFTTLTLIGVAGMAGIGFENIFLKGDLRRKIEKTINILKAASIGYLVSAILVFMVVISLYLAFFTDSGLFNKLESYIGNVYDFNQRICWGGPKTLNEFLFLNEDFYKKMAIVCMVTIINLVIILFALRYIHTPRRRNLALFLCFASLLFEIFAFSNRIPSYVKSNCFRDIPSKYLKGISSDCQENHFRIATLNNILLCESDWGKPGTRVKKSARFDRTYEILPPNLNMIEKLESIEGYGSITVNRYMKFYKEFFNREAHTYKYTFPIYDKRVLGSKYLDMVGVKYILGYKHTNGQYFSDEQGIGKVLQLDNGFYLSENQDVMPRAYVVHDFRVIDDEEQTLSYLSSEEFNPRTEVVLGKSPGCTAGDKGIELIESEIVEYRPEYIKIRAVLKKSGILILTDTYVPGWEVYVDGKQQELLIANYTFRGVCVEKGDHIVEFWYKPRGYSMGMKMTFLGVAVFFVLLMGILCCKLISGKERIVGNG